MDQASLLIALLRASGIPTRYVQGNLDTSDAQKLILSMFPPTFKTVGFIPEDSGLSDPANDPQLLEETKEHYWVEFNSGNGFVSADPTFAEAQLEQQFAVV